MKKEKEKKEEKKEEPKKSRNWNCVVYNYNPLELSIYLQQSEWCLHYALIEHEHDLEKDGKTPKKPHIHLLLNVNMPVSKTWVHNRIYRIKGLPGELFANIITDKYMLYRYLTHKDDKDKYQYSEDQILSNDISYWKIQYSEKENDVESLINDILDGRSFRSLCIKYGRDYMKNYKSYIECAKIISCQETGYSYDYLRENGFDYNDQHELIFIPKENNNIKEA